MEYDEISLQLTRIYLSSMIQRFALISLWYFSSVWNVDAVLCVSFMLYTVGRCMCDIYGIEQGGRLVLHAVLMVGSRESDGGGDTG